MNSLRKTFLFIFIYATFSAITSIILYIKSNSHITMGFCIGALLSLTFTIIWVISSVIAMRTNTLVLMGITAGGFVIRLIILSIFVATGTFIFKMDLISFTISFLIGTIYSLIIEIWFFTKLNTEFKKLY